ncbi:hypothetical protein Lalb_Chr08g0243441 [Lupinus albus]|uniref:Uncharacterized protein n=1 Tax=Lupinus albus TaxID=3870 RepID=A0A6A4Q6N6_LUPAL|nr:hypothetical protein Lalb_Chr08g0243441 [Lupinus albus]
MFESSIWKFSCLLSLKLLNSVFCSCFIYVMQVVHFKGSRKHLMLESWDFYSSSNEIEDMLCLILGSGITKYDF